MTSPGNGLRHTRGGHGHRSAWGPRGTRRRPSGDVAGVVVGPPVLERGAPVRLDLDDRGPQPVLAFLPHLELERHNSVATGNVRLAAVPAFFRYCAMEYPARLAHCQRVLAVPFKGAAAPQRRPLVLVTGTCAPAAWREWPATIEFLGPLCGSDRDVRIDVGVAYTPAAREAAGGTAAIEAEMTS